MSYLFPIPKYPIKNNGSGYLVNDEVFLVRLRHPKRSRGVKDDHLLYTTTEYVLYLSLQVSAPYF